MSHIDLPSGRHSLSNQANPETIQILRNVAFDIAQFSTPLPRAYWIKRGKSGKDGTIWGLSRFVKAIICVTIYTY